MTERNNEESVDSKRERELGQLFFLFSCIKYFSLHRMILLLLTSALTTAWPRSEYLRLPAGDVCCINFTKDDKEIFLVFLCFYFCNDYIWESISQFESFCLNYEYYGYGRPYVGNLKVYAWMSDSSETVQKLWPPTYREYM